MKGRILVAAAAMLGVILFASTSFAAVEHSPTVVTVSMYDMGFKLSKSVVRPGTLVFRTVNDGMVEHDFRFKKVGPNGLGTPMLGPGESATIKLHTHKAGRYPFVCTVPGHALAGMKGTLVVK
jgi:nitrite reductase (NO-forming)